MNDDGKISPEKERLTRFVKIGPSSLKQRFKNKIRMISRGTLFTFRSRSEFVNFSDSGWNIKLISLGGGADGKRNGSGESDGKNLVRIRSILSSKKSV